jgi:hypothetical protein
MTAPLSELRTYIDALGTEDGSEPMLAAMTQVGTKFAIEEFTSDEVHERYLEFRRGGVDMLVVDGFLVAIFFRLAEGEEGAAYPRPESLIPGLDHGMPRQAVIEELGTPLRDEPDLLRFAVGGALAILDLSEGRVERLSLQFAVPGTGVGASAEEQSAGEGTQSTVVPPAPPTGEITRFIAAAGTSEGDPVTAQLIADLGSQVERHPVEDGRVKFLVLEDSGVDLQYRDGILEGVLIHIADPERTHYRRLDTLIDGLAFPATRADVRDALGTAETPRDDIDLYRSQCRRVMFHYTGEQLTTLSVVAVPAR